MANERTEPLQLNLGSLRSAMSQTLHTHHASRIWHGRAPAEGRPGIVGLNGFIRAMIWELASMTGGRGKTALALAALAAFVFFLDEGWPSMPSWWVFPAVIVAMALTPRVHPVASAVMAAGIMVAAHGLFVLRDVAGTAAILWLIGVVIASDVMGYFVGRILGGPKFWPAISPKKTWSGTIAGWIGATAVGAGFVATGQGEPLLLVLSPLVAFAGQMGDIAESWIKRRTGVKDSSHLIPGHGGVMDRFDALCGAMVAVELQDTPEVRGMINKVSYLVKAEG